jgi:hypothetical protein
MATQGWRQNELNPDLWQAMFDTKYTTVRTAVITPILVVFMFVVGAHAYVLLSWFCCCTTAIAAVTSISACSGRSSAEKAPQVLHYEQLQAST